jgi:hypothetical protein
VREVRTLMDFSGMTLEDFREIFDKIEAAGYDLGKVWLHGGDFSGEVRLVQITDTDGDSHLDLELC